MNAPRGSHGGLLLIILLAFGLRLHALDRQDLWGDEAFSVWLSSQPLPEVVAGGADTHPPLYPFLLYLWLRLAGSSPWAVRFLSAAVGTLLTPVVYLLGRQSQTERTGPLLAALLVAASPVLVYYAQETRMYGLVTLLAAASVYWTGRILRGRRGFPAYWLTTLAAAYTHYYAFFVILAENLVVLPALLSCAFAPGRPAPQDGAAAPDRGPDRAARGRNSPGKGDLGRWLAVQGAIVLAYLPWVAVQSGFLGGKASARFAEWDLPTALHIAGETVRAFGAGLALPAPAAWGIAALFLAAVALGLLSGLGRPSSPASRSSTILLAAYLLVPLALAWAVNPIMPFFYARYLLLIAPAFYLLAAAGVTALGRRWRPLGAAFALLLLAGSAYGLRGYYTDDAYLKGRYGQMMAYIQAHARPGDGLILANPLQRPLFEYYRPSDLDAYFFPRYEYPLEDPRTARDLAAIAADHPRLWLVRFGNPAEYDPNGTLTRWLATHGSKAYFGGWVDADLSLYVMTGATDGAADGAADKGGDIPHPLRADLGDGVRLLGYALSAEEVAPGETLLLTLYWQALAPMTERYTVFTHLLDGEGRIQAQVDSEPQGGALPTDRWTVGQVVQDNYALVLSAEAAPGPHVLEVGMYLLATMERLPVRDPDSGQPLGDRILLGVVEVVER